MLRELSIFSGAEDLTLALGLLWRTAAGLPRTTDNALPLDALAPRLGSAEGLARLAALAERLELPWQAPPLAEVERLFADELLSARALRLHRGRNVYSAGKAALWQTLWLPFRDALTLDPETRALTAELVSLRTIAGTDGIAPCADLLQARLGAMGFTVQRVEEAGHAPLLRAHRSARGIGGRVALYGHYDVEATTPAAWETDPWTLTERGGRLHGIGVGDNKAPLASRLNAIASMPETPELLWLIQGEEEIGSPLAHRRMAALLDGFDADLWLDENGYFDLDGTQRLLAFAAGEAPGSTDGPDERFEALLSALESDARAFGCGARREVRGLNKSFFPAGCPFRRALPPGARYLAIGVNDPASGIHQPNESVPMWTFPLHRRQLVRALHWATSAS